MLDQPLLDPAALRPLEHLHEVQHAGADVGEVAVLRHVLDVQGGEAARVPELAVPTLAEGETWTDLLADRASFEDFDVEAAGRRGMHYAALDQLAIEHLLGARS